jgi:ribosomal protein S18 acetylase RimI-like enzyme
MTKSNVDRMLKLVEEFFDMKSDPEQLAVNQEVLHRLRAIDPSSQVEVAEDGGPIAWLLLIPTTERLMRQFVGRLISEQQLFDETPIGVRYDAVYLCSAIVLPEHRRQGIAREAAEGALREIISRHPIKTLFVWGFSDAGQHLANRIAHDLGLPLLGRLEPPRAIPST